MEFYEAKARAFCNTIKDNYENAYNCKILDDVQNDFINSEIKNMKILHDAVVCWKS